MSILIEFAESTDSQGEPDKLNPNSYQHWSASAMMSSIDICRMNVPNMFILKVPLYPAPLSLSGTEDDPGIHQVYADIVVKWCENSLNASA